MSALLGGGLQRVFGAAFGAIYLDAMLHRRIKTFGAGGDATVSEADATCKAAVDSASRAMRGEAGYVEGDVAIFVLRAGGPQTITTDDEITVGGERFMIESVATDIGRTHWVLRGREA